ncbi:putative LPS assembly protein LptD [Chryseosolibacter indicus]|uniref:LPS-assembly protein LptD n=1 Tax=Chryseosolibacter indicus TaxID=2782351 RepID=A0ABS5VVT2_9BACT|nr:LPS-assembly protein LptD [Chryseosolibacter indicus]
MQRSSFILLCFLITLCSAAFAQVEPRVKTPSGTLPVKNDTSGITPPDSVVTQPSDTLKKDSVQAPPPKGDIETTINYTARDSIRATMDNKMIWLYGEAKIKYGVIELEADEIVIDYANNTITAQSTKDSLGNRIGYPIFKNGSEVYETKGIIYNFKTKRARIKEVVTQQGEGYLHSGTAFKNEKNEIFSINNSYTTCNLEHPHFRIRATKTKAIPDDKIVAGPFYLEFNDIPLPAGFLFGMFPAQRESKSGIIFPSYGEERRRGFNFRNGGYFFDISEYIKLAVTGDIYSKGSHALYVNSNYMKRYAYNGSFNFSYSKNRITDRIEDRSVSNDFRLAWSHSPQSKGTGRFSASVNAATSTFNKNNNLMFGAPNDLYNSGLSNITTKLSSNVSYNKRFAGTPFSLGVNLSHNQDLQTRLVDLPLPNLTLNMTNIYPFQRKGVTGPLDNFSIGYSMAATNRITNNLGRLSPTAQRDSIAPFTLDNLSLFFRNAKNGMRHTIPVSYSFKALKFFTVSPSINYEERWYLERLNWVRNSENVYRADTTRGFNRIANYSFSTSLNTRIYGMYFFKNPNSRVKAIRHIINPSISFGYTPDFTKNINYFTPIRDTATQEITQYRSNHEGFVYGGSNTGRAGSIGFGIGNNLEMKVKSPKDTVERKVMLLNNLSLSSSYNLMADSFKLAPIGISANSNILDNLININVSATLDPYNYGYKNITDTEGNVIRRVETRQRGYAWNGGSLGRITSATLALSTNLNPKGRSKEQSMREKVAEADIPEADKQHIMANPNAYVDFDIPWSLNLGYSASYTHPVNQKASIVHSLQMSGDLSISEKWKINYTSGYDFKAKEITTTSIGIARELHCWQLNMNWVPFGYFTSYNITIAVKASVLQDLKLERRKPFQDRF